jgi:hypothetical protein
MQDELSLNQNLLKEHEELEKNMNEITEFA